MDLYSFFQEDLRRRFNLNYDSVDTILLCVDYKNDLRLKKMEKNKVSYDMFQNISKLVRDQAFDYVQDYYKRNKT
jgi:uncharacterized lipoprotein YehR (DUF1307 family)